MKMNARHWLLSLLVACSGSGQGRIGLDELCGLGSARICRCDDGSDGAQLCTDNETWGMCDCTLVLSAAFCADDYAPGQEARCVQTAPTCTLVSPQPGTLGNAQRVSDVAAPYAVRFEVQTNTDAESVLLTADGQQYVVQPASGSAVFDAIALASDGDHEVSITCIGKAGIPKRLPVARYSVDSMSPGLTLQEPANDQHYAPGQSLQACVTTTGGDLSQVCVSAGGAPEKCVQQDACVPLACPGGPPFDVVARAVDTAGNETRVTATQVSCASSTPSALIVDPVANDRILASNQSAAPKKDIDTEHLNAQYNVKVCTSISQGTARLYGGLAGASGAVIATSTDFRAQQGECPNSYGYVAFFSKATLPESTALQKATLDKATRLYAEIEDVTREVGTSASVDIWVDTSLPYLYGYIAPINVSYDLCSFSRVGTTPLTVNYLYISGTTVSSTITFQNPSVNSGLPYAPTGATYEEYPQSGSRQWTQVTFQPGVTQIFGSLTEPSGNTISLKNCAVTIGNHLAVTWVTPTLAMRALNIDNQGPSSSAPGWQGLLQVRVDEPAGGNVDFTTTAGAVLATAVPCAPSGSVCIAEATVSIPDSPDVSLVATATASGRSPGSATLEHLRVDTVAPTGVANLTATIVNRRGGVLDLQWSSGQDQGERLQSYDVFAVRDGVIGEPLPVGAERINFAAVPAMPGQPDGVRVYDRIIERNYSFAVCPKDRAGNRGACATVQNIASHFKVAAFPSLNADEYPGPTDGSCDVNGDGLKDLLVGGYGSRGYIYFGQAGGMPSSPGTTFVGAPNSYFGLPVRCAGDLDGDGRQDIVIPASSEDNGRVYIYRGRSTWPAMLNASQADSAFDVDATAPGYDGVYLAIDVTRVGDFDQDGADDIAVGASYNFNNLASPYDYSQDMVFIYRGVPAGQMLPSRAVAPRDEGSRLIRILGEPHPDSHYFGFSLFGLGAFYPGSGPSFLSCGWNGRAHEQRAYAITGAANAPFQQSVYDHAMRTDTPCQVTGSLGSVFGRPVPVRIGTRWIPDPVNSAGQVWQWVAELSFTDAQQGIFGGRTVRLVNDRFYSGGDASGAGAFNGAPGGVNVFGGSEPDFVMTVQGGTSKQPIFGWRATTLMSMEAGDYPISTTADFVYDVPLPWAQPSVVTLAGDMDGDGWAELTAHDTGGTGFVILW